MDEREEIMIFVTKGGNIIIGRPVWRRLGDEIIGVQKVENPRMIIRNPDGIQLIELLGKPDVLNMHMQPEVSHLCNDKAIIAGYIKSTSGLTIAS